MTTSKPRFLIASLLITGIGMISAQAQAQDTHPWGFLFPPAPAQATPPAAAPAKQAQTPAPAPDPWSFFFPPPPAKPQPSVATPQAQAQPAPPPSYTPPPVPTFSPPPAPAPNDTPPTPPTLAPPQETPAAPPAKAEEPPPAPAPSLERLGKSLQNYFTEDEIKLLFEYMQEAVLAAFKGEEVALAPDLAFKLEVLYVRIQKEGDLYMNQLMQQLKRDLDKAIKEQLAPKPPAPPATPQKNRGPAGQKGTLRAL